MSYQKLDSEVLKIVTNVLKDLTCDETLGEHGRDNAQYVLDMIGRTYVSVAQHKFNEGKKDE